MRQPFCAPTLINSLEQILGYNTLKSTLDSKPKKQHFVPQFLLRNFGLGRKNKARVWVYDKAGKKCFNASVRDVGHENLFYEATSSDGRKLEGESFTQFADTRGAKAIEYILENRLLPLNSGKMGDLICFVALQIIRVPSTRNLLEFAKKHMIQKWGPNIHAEGDARPLAEYTEEDSKFSAILSLKDFRPIADDLKDKVCFLTQAPSTKRFIISDNPVVRHNYLDYGPRGSLGTRKRGIHVFMPVSSKYCVEFLCPETASKLSASTHGRDLLLSQSRGLPYRCVPENVEFVNSLQVIQSERWIYAREEMDLAIAAEMITEHRDLSVPAFHKTIGFY